MRLAILLAVFFILFTEAATVKAEHGANAIHAPIHTPVPQPPRGIGANGVVGPGPRTVFSLGQAPRSPNTPAFTGGVPPSFSTRVPLSSGSFTPSHAFNHLYSPANHEPFSSRLGEWERHFHRPEPTHPCSSSYRAPHETLWRHRYLSRKESEQLLFSSNNNQTPPGSSSNQNYPTAKFYKFPQLSGLVMPKSYGGGGGGESSTPRKPVPQAILKELVGTLDIPKVKPAKPRHPKQIQIVRHKLPQPMEPSPDSMPPLLEHRLLSGQELQIRIDEDDQANPKGGPKPKRHPVNAESDPLKGAFLNTIPAPFRKNAAMAVGYVLATINERSENRPLELNQIIFEEPKETQRGFSVSGIFERDFEKCQFDAELDIDQPESSWVGQRTCASLDQLRAKNSS